MLLCLMKGRDKGELKLKRSAALRALINWDVREFRIITINLHEVLRQKPLPAILFNAIVTHVVLMLSEYTLFALWNVYIKNKFKELSNKATIIFCNNGR